MKPSSSGPDLVRSSAQGNVSCINSGFMQQCTIRSFVQFSGMTFSSAKAKKELAAAVQQTGNVFVPSVLSCSTGTELSNVQLSAKFEAGMWTDEKAQPQTLRDEVGMMSVRLDGDDARTLFNAMSTTFSPSTADTFRHSPNQDVACSQENGNHFCVLRGFVGF